jgi:ABC-type cobalamin/Fe3+-siderophores transport system ATPase subunit
MKFYIIESQNIPPGIDDRTDVVFLHADNWNDYSYYTTFYLEYRGGDGNWIKIGSVKIAYKGQKVGEKVYRRLSEEFTELSDDYIALGSGIDFYENINKLSNAGLEILKSINDVVLKPALIEEFTDEGVFNSSILRDSSVTSIRGEYQRALKGLSRLSDYWFSFERKNHPDMGDIAMDFIVDRDALPKNNMHAIIGRNGIGKTTILNGMVKSILGIDTLQGQFYDKDKGTSTKISKHYFSRVVSVSFSAFDSFTPPEDQIDPSKGTCYFYIGLKSRGNNGALRSLEELHKEACYSLINCFSNNLKTERWKKTLDYLCFDSNFSSMNLEQLYDIYITLSKNAEVGGRDFAQSYYSQVSSVLEEMSSGHAVVFFTLVDLIEKVEEKTLVLFDEPESHLHPPLLSAFMRAISDLLVERNAVAVIATHSPVVLQEIPSSSVWKIYREGRMTKAERPKIETYGENVGQITRDVFRLDVDKSGYIQELKSNIFSNSTYDGVFREFSKSIGSEGRAMLMAMLQNRESDDDTPC